MLSTMQPSNFWHIRFISAEDSGNFSVSGATGNFSVSGATGKTDDGAGVIAMFFLETMTFLKRRIFFKKIGTGGICCCLLRGERDFRRRLLSSLSMSLPCSQRSKSRSRASFQFSRSARVSVGLLTASKPKMKRNAIVIETTATCFRCTVDKGRRVDASRPPPHSPRFTIAAGFLIGGAASNPVTPRSETRNLFQLPFFPIS